MPGVSKLAKGSKRRPASNKNGEMHAKTKKSNKSVTQAADGSSSSSAISGRSALQLRIEGRRPRRSLAELERLFEEDSDIHVQVINTTRDTQFDNTIPDIPVENHGLLDDQNILFEPTIQKLEQLFEGDGVIELQVISATSADPNNAQLLLEGHGGLLLPSRAVLEHMFEGGDDVELQIINPNEDSSDALGFE